MPFIVLDYIFTKSVQSVLCFTLRKPSHATYSNFFTAVKMAMFSRNLSYFCSKHRLWVHIRTASVRRF